MDLPEPADQPRPDSGAGSTPALSPEHAASAATPGTMRPASTVGSEVWINALLGFLLIVLGSNFGRFVADRLRGEPYHTGVNWTEGPLTGTEVAYFDLVGDPAWTDAGLFTLGVVALIEVVAASTNPLLPARVAMAVWVLVLLLTAGTMLLNVQVCLRFFRQGITPVMSACAVLFGAWVLLDAWRALRRARAASTFNSLSPVRS